MAQGDNYQPVYILPEGSNRTQGKDAQRLNITAARLVAETIRTTLGPKGMDKMLVDSVGEITITNDGATILSEIELEHPSAKMIAEVAKTQEDEVGDGTTSAVVFAGELLQMAEGLLDQKVHPTVIIKGYRIAAEKAKRILEDIAVPLQIGDREILKKIAMTSMTGKGAESAKDTLADLTVRAIEEVYPLAEIDNQQTFDVKNIKVEKKSGGTSTDSTLIKGVLLDKERVHQEMPTNVTDGKVLLVNTPLEVKETESDMKVSVSDPSKMQEFLDMEEQMILKMVNRIKELGATVVFCQKGIDDLAQYYLAKHGIFALRRVKQSDMERLSKATGAKVVNVIDNATVDDMGYAGTIQEKVIGDERMTFVTDCAHPKAVTLLVRGGTSHVVDEIRRAVDDALGDLGAVLRNRFVVGGAGSVEVELTRRLREYSTTLRGREQLAVEAFARAIEVIPKTLAENSGLDPIDVLTELKNAHENTQLWSGLDVFSGKLIHAIDTGVIEPLGIKMQAISCATDVATMILRIDDVILTSQGSQGNQPQYQQNPSQFMQ
jgi:thermosome